jgi:hypothetical protein
VLFASHSWLKGIFGYDEIATDIPFLLAGAVLPYPPGLTLTGTHRPIRLAFPGSLRPIGRPCDGGSRHETKAHWPVGSIPHVSELSGCGALVG